MYIKILNTISFTCIVLLLLPSCIKQRRSDPIVNTNVKLSLMEMELYPEHLQDTGFL